MKNISLSGMFLGVALVAGLGLTACGQKKDDAPVAAVDGRARVSGQNNLPTNPLGWIKDKGTYVSSGSLGSNMPISASQFQRNVSDFVAAAWNVDGLGRVDDQSVVMQSYFEMADATKFNLAVSNLKIWITDDNAKNQSTPGITPYFVHFSQATSGSINGNQFSIVFRDDFQEVTVDGSFNGDSTVGKLSFRNLKDAAGGQLKSANPMGYYNIMTCAMFNCKK